MDVLPGSFGAEGGYRKGLRDEELAKGRNVKEGPGMFCVLALDIYD